MKKITPRIFVVAAIVAMFSMSAFAAGIFTTDRWGNAVNDNLFDLDRDVYLNGGPNNTNAAGLEPNATFYFQVTDPSGKTLLSILPAVCRQVTTDAEGRLNGPVVNGCNHSAGEVDVFTGSVGVQLAPFNPTPNNGGVYKVWLIPVEKADIGDDGISLSFRNSAAKTDNFKLRVYLGND